MGEIPYRFESGPGQGSPTARLGAHFLMHVAQTMQTPPEVTAPQINRSSFFNFSITRDVLVGFVLVFAYVCMPFWIGGLRLYSYNWELFYGFNTLINLICGWYIIGRFSLKYFKHRRVMATIALLSAMVIVLILPLKIYQDLAGQMQQYSGKMRLVQADQMMILLADQNAADNNLIISPTDFKRFTQAMCRCGDGSSIKVDYLPHTARIVNFECREFGSQRMPEPWQSECR